jgi:hypothetical protein
MIAPANPNPDDLPDFSPGGGGPKRGNQERDESGLSPLKHARMVDRAVRRRWNIDPDKLDSVAQRMVEIAVEEKPQVAVIAGSVVARMEAQNQADEHRLPPPKPEAGQTLNVVNINLSADDWKAIRQRGISVKDYIREMAEKRGDN